MRKHKKTNLTKLLQSIVSAACVWALLLGLILPVAATETVSTEAGEPVIVESNAEGSLLNTIRSEVAAFIETYGLTQDMPDQVLADVYTALNGEQSQAAWNKLNDLLVLAEGLTQDEADALLAEANTKLCQRFYNIIVQINTPAFITDVPCEPISGISVNISGEDNVTSGSITEDKSEITATAKALKSTDSCGNTRYTAKTVTATITNTSGSTANLGFAWATKRCNDTHSVTATVGGTTAELSGTYSTNLPLKSSESVTVTLKSCSDCVENSTLSLSDFWINPVAETSPVTFVYDSSLGSITVAGNAIESGETYNVPSDGGVSIAATVNTNVTFLGWINDATGQRYSPDASTTLESFEPVTIRAVFIGANSSGWYLANNTHLFNDLNAATKFAKETATYKTVTLMNNATLPAGDYTIPAGVTLLIPFDSSNTLCTTAPKTSDATYLTAPTAYRTLTMASGAHITVNGAISVSGTQHSAMAKGTPFGPVGFITMASGSTITVNNGGNLYVWGFIAGSGAVTIKSGGTVYECFQISDWRGGSATSAMANNEEKIFPITQYHVQNVEVPMTLEAGAFEKGFMSVAVSYVGIQSTSIDFIGPNSLFILNSGSITKDYDESTDRLIIELNNCTLNIDTVTLSVKVSIFGSVNLKSSDYILPITSNMTVNVNSGSSVDLSQNIAFLPGTELNIAEGAVCTVSNAASVIFYDVDNWGKYCGAGNATMTYVSAVSDGTRAERAALADAAIKVNGTLDATNGYLYTTGGGANIYSTGNGQVIQRVGTETVTYQATYIEDGYTPHEISITPANLKNADGTYVATAAPEDGYGAGTYTYSKADGVWHKWNGTKCEICELFKICGTSVKAGDALDIFFYVDPKDFPDYKSGAYKAEITRTKLKEVNGVYTTEEETKIADPIPSSAWVENQNLLRFSYNGIAAKEMMDIVTVKIVDSSGKQVSQTITESIEGYATRALQKLENTNGLHTTLVDMLNYGALAQKYFGYRADNLANASLSDAQKQLATPSVSYENSTSSNSAATYPLVAASVTAGNYVHMTFYFTNITDLTGFTAEISYTDHYGSVKGTLENPIIINGSEFDGPRKTQDGRIVYGPTVKNLAIADGRQDITCVLKRDGTIIDTVTSSVESYIAETIKYNPSDAVLIELCENLLKFTDSAHAYFHPGI